jgi:hypothetical protein
VCGGKGGGQKLVFLVFFVYYIYCTTLLIYGIVKRKKKNSKISILYLYLSKDITPEKEGTTFLNLQE